MLKSIYKNRTFSLFLILIFYFIAVKAEISQVPLLTQAGAVPPNLAIIFDNSGSMEADYIYQYGYDSGSGYGTKPSTTTYAQYSPDANLLYYDPRVRYNPPVNADGSLMTAGTVTASTTEFKVYFFRPNTSNTYKISSVTVTNGGSNYVPTSGKNHRGLHFLRPQREELQPKERSPLSTKSSPPSILPTKVQAIKPSPLLR